MQTVETGICLQNNAGIVTKESERKRRKWKMTVTYQLKTKACVNPGWINAQKQKIEGVYQNDEENIENIVENSGVHIQDCCDRYFM